jgi:hypothetical protein
MELSGCGDECRRTAILYEALRCYEVLGLASVEWIPRLSRSKPSFTIIYYNILSQPLLSPYRQHTKNTRFTKTLCSQYYGKTKQTYRNVCIWSSGVCNGWPVSRHQPLDTKLLPAEVLIVLAKSDRVSRYPFRQQTVESNSLRCGFHFKDESFLPAYKQRACYAVRKYVSKCRRSQKSLCTNKAFIRNIPQTEFLHVFFKKIQHVRASVQARGWPIYHMCNYSQ